MAALTVVRRTVRLHAAQHAFCNSPAIYRAFVGGRGSGKSYAISYDLIKRAKPGRLYMMVSPTYTILQDTDFRTFCALARELGVLDERKISPPRVVLSTGAEVLFRSADDPDRLRGPNLSGVSLNEASLMSRDAFDVCIACLREGGETGWLSAGFTPRGRLHWTYEVFGSGGPGVALFRARSADNPFLASGFVEQIKTQYSGLRALQELEGLFTDVEGAEFPGEWFGWPGFWFQDWPDDLALKVMALDPSKGAETKKPGDYQALILYGRHADGTEYVEADLSNTRPMCAVRDDLGRQLTAGMCETAMEAYRRFRPEALALEINTFQSLLKAPLLHAARDAQVEPRIMEYSNTVNKQVRIRRLNVPLGKKRMHFRDTPGTRLLVEQLRAFPDPEAHDDGPDALELCYRCAVEIHNGKHQRPPRRIHA